MPSHHFTDPQGLLKEKKLKYLATGILISKGYWKKTNSKKPNLQIIDPQGLLKEKEQKTQPPD